MKSIGLAFALAVASTLVAGPASSAPINVVVAENFWGEPVIAIGGTSVSVTAIIDNPGADPHEFEPTPANARAVADADIVIYNGIDYDPWMDKLIGASRAPKRVVIDVGTLLKRSAGDNPHLWYDPVAMPALVDAVVKTMSADDPNDAASFASNGRAYQQQLAMIADRIAALKGKFARTPVTATEPVFGYMAQALGLAMRNQTFQLAVMNDTEPSAKDTAAMETDLKTGKVKVLFFNSQVTDDLTDRLVADAKAANVAVVGVTETKPAGKTFVQWMLDEIDATDKALGGSST